MAKGSSPSNMVEMDEEALLPRASAAVFGADRMVGSVTEAEDLVQEAAWIG